MRRTKAARSASRKPSNPPSEPTPSSTFCSSPIRISALIPARPTSSATKPADASSPSLPKRSWPRRLMKSPRSCAASTRWATTRRTPLATANSAKSKWIWRITTFACWPAKVITHPSPANPPAPISFWWPQFSSVVGHARLATAPQRRGAASIRWRPHRHRLTAKLAAPRAPGNIAEAFRAGRGRGSRSLLGIKPGDERIHRQNDKEVHGEGDQQERDQRVDEVAVKKPAVVEREAQVREIRRADHRGNQRSKQVLYQRANEGPERHTDNDSHRHIHDVAAQQKILES